MVNRYAWLFFCLIFLPDMGMSDTSCHVAGNAANKDSYFAAAVLESSCTDAYSTVLRTAAPHSFYASSRKSLFNEGWCIRENVNACKRSTCSLSAQPDCFGNCQTLAVEKCKTLTIQQEIQAKLGLLNGM